MNKESASPSDKIEKNVKYPISSNSNSPESKFFFNNNQFSLPHFFTNNNNNLGFQFQFQFQRERKKSFFHNESNNNSNSNQYQRRMSAVGSPRIRFNANGQEEESFKNLKNLKKENLISLIPMSSVPQTPCLQNNININSNKKKYLPRNNSNFCLQGIRGSAIKTPISSNKIPNKYIISKNKLKAKNS